MTKAFLNNLFEEVAVWWRRIADNLRRTSPGFG
jgi:hypothetical protein